MKETNEEIREQVEQEDKKRDLGVYIGITIALFAIVAGSTGAAAVIMLRMLGIYRNTIGAYWMSCIPFIFPTITGISVAYKRRMIAIALHIPILLMAAFSGGLSYGYSISPVFDTSVNCTKHILEGDCEKTPLVYLYTVFGAVACGCSFLGILFSLCACQQARNRLRKRAERFELNLQRNIDIKADQLQQSKQAMFNSYLQPEKSDGLELNGVHKMNDHIYTNQVALSDDLTTKL